MKTALVKYDIGTYEGTIEVSCYDYDDEEDIIRKAKNILRKQIGSFPCGMYYESWRILAKTTFDE